jgi:hypothetical protein
MPDYFPVEAEIVPSLKLGTTDFIQAVQVASMESGNQGDSCQV